ncbi:methylenetetrahydrofolate dehydrogenase (NADP+)/methenyltetrahydrofolate cyclohydrolase [Bradyrhizobium sp. USDA 4449]
MVARIIDGKSIATSLREDCRQRVLKLQRQANVTPGLAVILVGSDPASRLYVTNKIRASAECGINSHLYELPIEIDQSDILDLIDRLNEDPAIHGILVQLPLPSHINIYAVLHKIAIEKDVDGFHLYNVGGLVIGQTIFSPCTPFGVLKLLQHERIPVSGQNVIIVGSSNIVGKPLALMMMKEEATVSVCHAKTRDLAQFTILADILVVAAGVPNLILPQMVKTGAVVIDVGINRLPSGRIVGDVEFDGVRQKASHLTPVPGGVGPMTVTMLISNTVSSAERSAACLI